MADANVKIGEIKQKITSLLSHVQQLRLEKDRLAIENEKLAASLADRDKKIEEIQNKNLHLQISRALGKGGAGETGLKQRLDEYIREIEATIAHLKD